MNIVEYKAEMGENKYPEGFEGLTVEDQMKFFRTTQRSSYTKTNWNERTLEYTKALEDNPDVKAVIVKDGCIVGAMIAEWFSRNAVPVMLDQCVCTYYASDNDGAGYNEREDYTFFICVPSRD